MRHEALTEHFELPISDENQVRNFSQVPTGKVTTERLEPADTHDKAYLFQKAQFISGAGEDVSFLSQSNEGIMVSSSLSEEDQIADKIDLWPNPTTNGSFAINNRLKKPVEMNVYSITGKCVVSRNINLGFNKINVPDLTSGIYIVRYEIDNKVSTEKLAA